MFCVIIWLSCVRRVSLGLCVLMLFLCCIFCKMCDGSMCFLFCLCPLGMWCLSAVRMILVSVLYD